MSLTHHHGALVIAAASLLSIGALVPSVASARDGDQRYVDEVFSAIDVDDAVVYRSGVPDLVSGDPVSLAFDRYTPGGDDRTDRPAIVWIHGGGFRVGTRQSLHDVADAYARRGYVTFSIDYRLDPGSQCQNVQDGAVDSADRASETVRCWRAIQAAQDDASAAVAFVRDHAAEYGIDPDRIVAAGFSAGAVTAVNLAQRADLASTPADDGRVDAALAASGCNYDLSSIDAGDAPIAMLASGHDRAVPFECSVATVDAADTLGIPVARNLFPEESLHARKLYLAHQEEVDATWCRFLVDVLHLA